MYVMICMYQNNATSGDNLKREQDNSPKNQLTHEKNGQLTQILW